MPFSLKNPKKLYNQKSLERCPEVQPPLCWEGAAAQLHFNSSTQQFQSTQYQFWLTETTRMNLGQNNVAAQTSAPHRNSHKGLPTENWSLHFFLSLCFPPKQKWAAAAVCCSIHSLSASCIALKEDVQSSSSTTSKGFTCAGGPLLKVLNRAQQRTQPSVTYTFIPCLYFCAFSQLKHMQWTCLSSNRGSISDLPLVCVHFTARLQTNITLSACFRSNYSRCP